jgi:cytochrome c
MRNALTATLAAIVVAASAAAAGALECDAAKAESGEKVFRRCQACHSTDADDNGVGPTLHGVVGRPVASVADFNYSDAMKAYAEANPTWDEAHLVNYLHKPRETVKGTKMAFAGIPKDEDREAVVCYLAQFK